MALRLTNLAAVGAALAALLVGLVGGAPFWTVLGRTVASYLIFFAAASLLATLARIGLSSSPEVGPDPLEQSKDREGGGGTESADPL